MPVWWAHQTGIAVLQTEAVMPESTPEEKWLLETRECFGEFVKRDKRGRVLSRKPCTELLPLTAGRCPKCGAVYAKGALASFMVKGAKAGINRSWMNRFCRDVRIGD